MNLRTHYDGILRSGHAGTVLAIWGVALISALGASYQIKNAVESFSAAKQIERVSIPEIHVINTALTKADYDAIAGAMNRLHPEIEVRSESDGLIVQMRTNTAVSFDKWRLAVLDANQSVNALWKTETLCVGAKCPESPYRIKLSAYRASARAKTKTTQQ